MTKPTRMPNTPRVLLQMAVAAITLTACTKEASEAQIRRALAECNAQHNARIITGNQATSPLVVDFDLPELLFKEKSNCLHLKMEELGVGPLTLMNGPP